jgi:hypothetical protein
LISVHSFTAVFKTVGAALAYPVHRQRCRRTESRDCFRTGATAIGLGRRAEYSSPVSRSVCRMISLPWAWSAESLGAET